MKDNKHTPNFELLAKYFAGEASVNEIEAVDNWVESGNTDEFARLKDIWYRYEAELNAFDTERALEQVNRRIDGKHRRLKLVWGSMVAAAAVALLIIIPLAFPRIDMGGREELVTLEPLDSVSTHSLNDGSTMLVNVNSTVRLASNFSKSRVVELNGEAYFSVEGKGDKNPFKVVADSIEVVVVGTKFNVKAYPGSQNLVVSVDEGKVQVWHARGELLALIERNQRFEYNKETAVVHVEETDTQNDSFWHTQKIVFTNTPLPEVARTLSQIFNVSVNVNVPNAETLMLTTNFEGSSLEEILTVVSLTLDVRVVKSGSNFVIENAQN